MNIELRELSVNDGINDSIAALSKKPNDRHWCVMLVSWDEHKYKA